jgi:hypothetical protein
MLFFRKEPSRFKDLEEQLNIYHQQWQADQQKQIIAKMTGKMPGKIKEEKRKKMNEIITIQVADAVALAKAKIAKDDAGCRGGRDGRGNNNSEHLENVECFNCGKKGHYSIDCSTPRKNGNEDYEQSNMVSKSGFKNLFQSSLTEMLTKKDKQAKKK